MKTNERRERIIEILKNADRAVPAKELAEKFDVSRQVIVQDLAVIKSGMQGIIVTNRGYLLQENKAFTREFKVQHGIEGTEEELNLIVDCGGIIKNVSISHTVYNRVTANMDIRSRQDVSEFMDKIGNSKSSLLGNATSGYHYHLVEAASEDRLNLIEKKLEESGFIVPRFPWEME